MDFVRQFSKTGPFKEVHIRHETCVTQDAEKASTQHKALGGPDAILQKPA